jgi:hypothetical protein
MKQIRMSSALILDLLTEGRVVPPFVVTGGLSGDEELYDAEYDGQSVSLLFLEPEDKDATGAEETAIMLQQLDAYVEEDLSRWRDPCDELPEDEEEVLLALSIYKDGTLEDQEVARALFRASEECFQYYTTWFIGFSLVNVDVLGTKNQGDSGGDGDLTSQPGVWFFADAWRPLPPHPSASDHGHTQQRRDPSSRE